MQRKEAIRKAVEFAERRNIGSPSLLSVLLYPGGQLGNERQINEAILEGSIQIGVGAGAMANLAPIYNIVQVPFLIQGQQHMAAIADKGEIVLESLDPFPTVGSTVGVAQFVPNLVRDRSLVPIERLMLVGKDPIKEIRICSTEIDT